MNRKALILIGIAASLLAQTIEAHTKLFNHTPYEIKIKLSGVYPKQDPYIVPAGEKLDVLTGIASCVIITHCKVWVLDGNKDDFAEQPNIDEKVYLDRCFKEIHVLATPTENGENSYAITTSHQ